MGRKTFIVLGVTIVVIVAAGVFFFGDEPFAPSLTITAPGAGAPLRPGETQVISWKSRGVPTTDHISVTIRRIPPPALPTEGQKFDPVIFTNLPNTGSTNWIISPQYPDGTYQIAVNAYQSVPITSAVSGESPAFTIMHPELSSDVYPLYNGISWNNSETESFMIGTTTYTGASIVSASVTATMNPSNVFTPFENYYEQKLQTLGYTVDHTLAAGGHTGGQTAYRKGNNLVLTRFNIVYQTVPANAPSECPCDVTVSLFTSMK